MHSTPGWAAPLSPQTFYILLALAATSMHGYEIMGQVAEDSGGTVVLAPGTLYASLKRLARHNIIMEVGRAPQSAPGKPRRYYRITKLGRAQLDQERQRLERAAIISRQRLLGPRGWRVQ